jgi:hypothetical protein
LDIDIKGLILRIICSQSLYISLWENLTRMVLRNNDNLSYLAPVITILVVILGAMSAVFSQQLVTNSDFQDGLLGWDVVIVDACTSSYCGPRTPYPRIEPIASCNNYMESKDGFCMSFDTPGYSDGYIKQSLYVPNGPSLLEIKYKNGPYSATIGSAGIKIYVHLVELDTNKVTDFVLEPRVKETAIFRAPISHLSGKNVELRFGVKGEDCLSNCYTYVDYIKILINSSAPPATTAFTTYTTTLTSTETRTATSFTYVTVVTTASVTETVGETHVVTLTIPSTVTTDTTKIYTQTIIEGKTETIYSTITSTKTDTFVLTTTITLTKPMVQLGDFIISLEELRYITFIASIVTAICYFLTSYYSLRTRIPRSPALGFAILYSFFGGLLAPRVVPSLLRATLIPAALEYIDYLFTIAFIFMIVTPTIYLIVHYAKGRKQSSGS